VFEERQVRQNEAALHRLAVAGEVAGDVLDRLQPPRVESAKQLDRGGAVGGEVVPLTMPRLGQLAPGGVGVLERDLAVEAGAAGVPERLLAPAGLPGEL